MPTSLPQLCYNHELCDVNICIILSSIQCTYNILKFDVFHSPCINLPAGETYDSENNVYKCIHIDIIREKFDMKECVFIFTSVRHLVHSKITLYINCIIVKSENVVHAVYCSLYQTTGDNLVYIRFYTFKVS